MMDSRRLTSAVLVHAGAFVVAVLSLGKSSMHLGHDGPVNTYSTPRVTTVEARPMRPAPVIHVRRVERPENPLLPAPVFGEANSSQDVDSGSMIMTGLRP